MSKGLTSSTMSPQQTISRVPDADARCRIAQNLELNMLVEAGAGSGKTHSLASRMSSGVVSGRYRVEEMAAVTFTRKAAAELRGRFQVALENRLQATAPNNKLTEVERGRVDRALMDLERLFSGTIHAFCARLLQERPVEAGVAPGFSAMDEVEDAAFRDRTWQEYIARERAVESSLLRNLDDARISTSDLRSAFERVSLYEEVDFPAGDGQLPATKAFAEKLSAFWKKLQQFLPEVVDPQTTCGVQQTVRKHQSLLRVLDSRIPADLTELIRNWEREPRFVMKWWPGDRAGQTKTKQVVLDLIDQFRQDVVAVWLSAWQQYVYRLSMTLLLGARSFARDQRRRAQKLNYGDLLQISARLLRENSEVRCSLQSKYRWLFVDEFQDTDPIQAEVILLLARDEKTSPQEVDWTRSRIRPGALFIVGDPKQSIYRFRRADIEIYNQVRNLIKRDGTVETLTASFRSLPGLCSWANGAFRNILPKTETAVQPAFQPLEPVRSPVLSGPPCVQTLTSVGASREAVAAEEARKIARYVFNEVESGRRNWQDFLVITRTRRLLGTYATELENLQIPVEVSGAGAFGDSSAVEVLLSLLSALSDPDDGVALVSVLRGPLFGLSDADLFRYKLAGQPFILTASIQEAGPERVIEAIQSLQKMYRWTRILPAPAAVDLILEESGLAAYLAAASPGGAEAGDLLHAVDRIRRVTEQGGSLANAVTALGLDAQSSEVESVSLEPGRRGVVRLMNLHKAKGLEAPVVFLADPCGGVKARADIRIRREGNKAVGFFQIGKQKGDWGWELLGQPADWERLEAEELAFIEAEEKRLLYTASTRACDLLVVGRVDSAKGHFPWVDLAPYLVGLKELVVPDHVALPPSKMVDCTPTKRAIDAGVREGRKVLLEPSWHVESVTKKKRDTVQLPQPGFVESLAAEADSQNIDEEVSEPELSEPTTALSTVLDEGLHGGGAGWGIFVHALLEYAANKPEASESDLELLAKWFTFSDPDLQPFVAEAVQVVVQVTQSENWGRVRSAETRYAEVPFAVCHVENGGSRNVVEGVIDLVYRTRDGWEILDYKTDQITGSGVEGLVRHYEPQLLTYREYWQNIVAEPVHRSGIYAVRGNRIVWLGDGE